MSKSLASRFDALAVLGRKHRWFVGFVLVPTLLAALYFGLIASDQYASESRFVIKSPSGRTATGLTLASLVQTSGMSSGTEQAHEVLDFLRSRDALAGLEARLKIRERYRQHGADIFSRFPQPWQDDSREDLFSYFLTMTSGRIDKETSVAVLETRAFSPEDARDANAALLDLSEGLVNRLNDRAQTKAIAEAERRVGQAQERVRKARIALSDYRNSQELIDPAKQATGVLEVSNRLVSERAALEAQLRVMRQATPRNPAIPSLAARVEEIAREADAQSGRVVGTRGAIASKLGGYENLALQQEFATQNLAAAEAALASARVDAQKQQFYLERVVEPGLPDEAEYPHRWTNILVVFASALCLYFIGWMLVVGILEHAPED